MALLGFLAKSLCANQPAALYTTGIDTAHLKLHCVHCSASLRPAPTLNYDCHKNGIKNNFLVWPFLPYIQCCWLPGVATRGNCYSKQCMQAVKLLKCHPYMHETTEAMHTGPVSTAVSHWPLETGADKMGGWLARLHEWSSNTICRSSMIHSCCSCYFYLFCLLSSSFSSLSLPLLP